MVLEALQKQSNNFMSSQMQNHLMSLKDLQSLNSKPLSRAYLRSMSTDRHT